MSPAQSSPLRAAARLAVYGLWTLLLIPLQTVAVAAGWPLSKRLPVFYHRSVWRLLALDVKVRGVMSATRPTLFVCNHASYIDIEVLGGLIPGSFVAKSEVAGWPFFGLLAKLQRTVFVDRHARRAAVQRDAMQQRLDAGDNLILFPEGTSSDGSRVLPFKSALFAVAERTAHGEPLTVQPVSIAYTRLDGIPMGYAVRPFFAWYGDMNLGRHLFRLAGFGRVTIEVAFHPPTTLLACGSRREMARVCRAAIGRGLIESLYGRAAETVA